MPYFTTDTPGRPLYPAGVFPVGQGICFALKWPTEPKTASNQGRKRSGFKPKASK